MDAIEQQIQEADLSAEEARHKYVHLRSTCVSAQQVTPTAWHTLRLLSDSCL